MRMHAGPAKAFLRLASLMQKTLDSQAQLWAYVDAFHYLAIVSVLCVPMAFVLRRAQS